MVFAFSFQKTCKVHKLFLFLQMTKKRNGFECQNIKRSSNMKVHLPDFKGQENNTLYFIGNGFDLFHNLKTHYSDFHDWLIKYHYDDFVGAMEKLFPALQNGDYLLWKDFEEALACADLLNVHNDFFQGNDDGWFDVDVQNRVAERIKYHLYKIPSLMREWIKSIKICDAPQLLDLSTESLFLSFNYTLLLENKYFIPSDHILHIHNSIEVEEPLITGHKSGYDKDGVTTNNINIEKSTQNIAVELNRLRKPVDTIIKRNQSFFDSLSKISNIVVFGHSLSEIDRLYFTEVFHHVKDDAKWYFVVIDEEAKNNIEALIVGYNDLLKKRTDGSRYRNKMKIENCSYIFIRK